MTAHQRCIVSVNAVPDLGNKPKAVCFRGCVLESTTPIAVVGSLHGSQLLHASVSLSIKNTKIFPPTGQPSPPDCRAQQSLGTVGFVSSSWLIFGARAICQCPSLFLSSPFFACDIEVRCVVTFAKGFIKAAERPTTSWVTPVGMSCWQAATIHAVPPERPCLWGHAPCSLSSRLKAHLVALRKTRHRGAISATLSPGRFPLVLG